MKIKNSILSGARPAAAGLAAVCGAALGAALFATPCQAQNSPVGTWDCVQSGVRSGVAYIIFSNNFTFGCYEAIVPNRSTGASGDDVLGRGTGIDTGRNDFDGPGAPIPPFDPNSQGVWGSELVDGPWGFDDQGRVIGYFTELGGFATPTTNSFPILTNMSTGPTPITSSNVNPLGFCLTLPIHTNTVVLPYNTQVTLFQTNGVAPIVTNQFASLFYYANVFSDTNALDGSYFTTNTVSTNQPTYVNQTICYSNQITETGQITNTVSFVAKVVPGSRLNLVASTTKGKVTYRGVPARTLVDLTGPWNGLVQPARAQNPQFVEFFTMHKSVDLAHAKFPNVYDVNGSGPGYTYSGHAILSSQKKLGFVVGTEPDAETVRAVTGPYSISGGTGLIKANLAGWDQPAGTLTNWVRFKISNIH